MTQPAGEAPVSVRDAPEQKRFEIWVGDALAGFTVYRPRPDAYVFVHTEIGSEYGGQGLASVLIKYALDDMRARGLAVLPDCPFVRRYISRHTEYLDLVPEKDRRRYQLPVAADKD